MLHWQNMKYVSQHPLIFCVFLGALMRLWFVVTSNHIYYPDELYQSLEQAHRMVYGYGTIPWDIAYGLRSILFPLFLSVPLYLTKLLGINDPAIYTFGPALLMATVSLTLIPFGYYAALALTKKKEIASLTAFVFAIWYELIYFAPRALTETMSTYLFAVSGLLLITKKYHFIIGIIASFALILRIQYAPIFLGIVFLRHRQKLPLRPFMGGSLLSITLIGLLDWVITGQFLSHLTTNIRLSFLSGISELFGTEPWWFYLSAFAISSAGTILILAVSFLKTKKIDFLSIMLLTVLVSHTFLPHKEYRFIFLAIPLWLILFTTRMASKKHTPTLAAGAVLLSTLGLLYQLPYQSYLYPYEPLFPDPHIRLYHQIARDQKVCGVYDTTRSWVHTPGYYHLHKPVPLYTPVDENISISSISHVLTNDPNLSLAGFELLDSHGTTALYKRTDSQCQILSEFSYHRSFPFIDHRLDEMNARPVSSQLLP